MSSRRYCDWCGGEESRGWITLRHPLFHNKEGEVTPLDFCQSRCLRYFVHENDLIYDAAEENDGMGKVQITELQMLNIGVRAYNALRMVNCVSIAQIKSTPDEVFLAMKNVGRVTLAEIRQAVREREEGLEADSGQ